MVINKKTKAALNYTNPDYIQKMSDSLPHRIHMMSALHKVFFPTDLSNPHDPDHVDDLQLPAKERKSTENISEGIVRIKEKQMFQIPSKNRGLLNPFSNQQTNTEQALDLLTFHEVGEKEFKSYYEAHMVKTPSTQVSKKRYSLKTFEKPKVTTKKYCQFVKHHKQVMECLKRRLSECDKRPLDNIRGEQYYELPLAIAKPDGTKRDGQKSTSITFYTKRWENVQMPWLPQNWSPDSVVIDGMFMLNSAPVSGQHKTFGDYSKVIYSRFIMPHFKKGATSVAVAFDHPNRNGPSPKEPREIKVNRNTVSLPTDYYLCHSSSHKVVRVSVL